MSKLTMTKGKRAGEEFPLTDEVVLGREGGGNVDIEIADTKASRKHLKIVLNAGAHFLVDLNSRNGTLVNGKKVSRVRLKAGDKITVGKTEFEYVSSQTQKSKSRKQPEPAEEPAVTETMSQQVKKRDKPAAAAKPKTRKERFDPSVFGSSSAGGDAGLLSEDIAQRSFGFQLMVAGGALLFLLAIGGLAYLLTTIVIG